MGVTYSTSRFAVCLILLLPVDTKNRARPLSFAGRVIFQSTHSLTLSLSMSLMSISSKEALEHLKKLKPYDGWSIERKGSTARLVRRSLPLTDNFFLDIHYDAIKTGTVVGILSSSKDKAQGKVLVDKHGKPVPPTSKSSAIIAVSSYNASPATSSGNGSGSSLPPVDHEKNLQTLRYMGYFLGALVAMRAVAATLFGISALLTLVFPFAYLYAVMKCPAVESFDAKKQLKRVMRGHHLPEDHPDKPKGLLSQTLARISATVATEVATGLGYEIEITNLAGAAHLAKVTVPTSHMQFYWIGAMDNWHYVYSREI